MMPKSTSPRLLVLLTILLLALLSLAVSGCNQTPAETTPPASTSAAANTNATPGTAVPPMVTVPPQPTTEFFIPTPPVTSTASTLTIWLPPELFNLSPESQSRFTDQILAFDATHPDTTIVLETKAVAGQGGMLSYLRTGRSVAPSVLPDIIAMPVEQASAAFAEELIYSFGDLLTPSATSDLYPAAQTMAGTAETTYIYPFALANLPHLAVNTTVITATLPTTWEAAFASETASFVFPAAGRPGAILALELYLAYGGTLTNDAGQAALELAPLIQTLELLANGRANGTILLQSSNIATYPEAWQLFQNETADLITTTSTQFLPQWQSDAAPDFAASFTAIPGPTAPLQPLVNGWGWAITTTDPAQRALLTNLLALLTEPEFMGSWAQEMNLLPSRTSGFDSWPANDAYTIFLQDQLDAAVANPLTSTSNTIQALSNAVFDVISLSTSPQVAAEEAVRSLQP